MSPSHPDESARLAALRQYEILDTAREAGYDDIAKLASYICTTPVALVSLIDADRQWFKSTVGVDISETPRDMAFCAHAILGTDMLVVEDARADSRFAANPLVTGAPHIRFYAGAPLVTPEGHSIGTLCVIDSVPRHLTPEQHTALVALARQVVAHFELRRTAATLAAVLADVKTLSGLLPICAWCNKVRDDAGYWGRIEEYLKERSTVKTTHGICPSCYVAVSA